MAKGASRTQDSSLPKDGGVDTKLFSKLLSKERYNPPKHGDASFRVLYYGAGGAGSVPFLWESQPGTPKHSFNDNPPPPLTPPPYYLSSPGRAMNQKNNSKKTLKSMFTKTPSNKKINNVSPHSSSSSYSSSSSFSSSSHSVPSTPVHARKNGRMNIYDKSVELGYEGGMSCSSPTSTLCLGASRKMKGYYYPIKSVKKVVLSIVGQGGARG